MNKFAWVLLVLIGAGIVVGSVVLLKMPSAGNQDRSSTSQDGRSGEINNPVASSGKQTYRLEVDGATREFIVYRPEGLSDSEEVPVVFMFHGGGGRAEGQYRDSGWTQKADEEGFMVVYPQALKYHVYAEEKVKNGQVVQNLAEYATRWNNFSLSSSIDPEYPDQELYDDIAFVHAMVDFLEDNYAVDSERMYATGFSNGGGMVNRLMVEGTDLFAAFAPTAAGGLTIEGLEALGDYKPANFVARPTVGMIGSMDPKLTHSAEVDEFSTDESAAQDGDAVHERYIEPQLEVLELADEYAYEAIGKSAHFTYSEPQAGSDSQAEYQLYVVDGLKHVYPNGKSNPLSAPDIFWSFFEGYSL